MRRLTKHSSRPVPLTPSFVTSSSPGSGLHAEGGGGWRGLTQLPDLQDLTEHFGELDGAAAEGALVLVFPAAVLQDDLWGRRQGLGRRDLWQQGGAHCP